MLISILIPTYKRAECLKNNLEILNQHISQIDSYDKIEIVISNNCSPDHTDEIVNKFVKDNPLLNINYLIQKTNIGLEKNALEVLKHAHGKFVMYLGDDDYLHPLYLSEVIKKIHTIDSLTCILPSIKAITPDGFATGFYRDVKLKKTYHEGGFMNCLFNSWRGHQLSGVVLKRAGLLKSYKNQSVANIYPFIYFVSLCTLEGATINLINFPVSVTQVQQNKKDWDYEIDGLIGEIYDNYKKLPVSFIKKNILQIALLKNQKWRYLQYLRSKNYKQFYKCLFSIMIGENTLFVAKAVSPFVIHYLALKWVIINQLSKIYKYIKR